MSRRVIKVPERLQFTESINFVNQLTAIDHLDTDVEFDFKHHKRIDPFSLIYVGSAFGIFIKKFNNVRCYTSNFRHLSYHAHMGFFKVFGGSYGKNPGEAKGNQNYVPITIYEVSDLKKEAVDYMMHPAEYLQKEAKRISIILTTSENGELTETLTYCIREIFRNVIEHSESDKFVFCAQYRPSGKVVSFALLDKGIGLYRSLKKNPTLTLHNNRDAIKYSTQPAISSRVYPGQKNKPKGAWANSGYGLYMTKRICQLSGSFFIASGDTGCYTKGNSNDYLDVTLDGTALNLAFNTSKLKPLKAMLKEFADHGQPVNTPSTSSFGLI